MSAVPLLDLKDVTKMFKVGGGLGLLGKKTIRAVDNVSFTIPADEPKIVALVGESGSGKSTICRLIVGLLRPTYGSILYRGKDIRSLNRKDWLIYRRNVQMIFQDPYSIYNPFYKVDRMLKLVIKKLGIAPEKDAQSLIEDALKMIGLRPEDVLGRYPHQLSGGERQRLMLARILIAKPELVVADEPVSMLDVSLRVMFLDKILEFKRKFKISSLYVTHDLNTAYYVADEVIVLYSGKIVERGKMESVIKNPLHPYTQLLLRCIPNPDPKKRWMDEVKAEEVAPTKFKKGGSWEGCIYRDRCPFAMDVCKNEPPMIKAEPGHEVACFLYHE